MRAGKRATQVSFGVIQTEEEVRQKGNVTAGNTHGRFSRNDLFITEQLLSNIHKAGNGKRTSRLSCQVDRVRHMPGNYDCTSKVDTIPHSCCCITSRCS